jgi:hypothetical protein
LIGAAASHSTERTKCKITVTFSAHFWPIIGNRKEECDVTATWVDRPAHLPGCARTLFCHLGAGGCDAASDTARCCPGRHGHQAHLFQNRDYPVLTDYRALFGGLFQRMYGLDQAGLQQVFAAVQPNNLALL